MSHRFQVHLRGLIDLLSNHLYSGPEVFVRELLQNGVDAIRAREQVEKNFVGQVSLEVSAAHDRAPTLLFADNGIGLTNEEVHRFLATIGESSKRASEGERPTDFIGQFGIGLLSCFLVSDEIVVVSRSAKGGAAIEWRGKPDGTYTLKELQHDLSPGTQVYLTCKPDMEEFFSVDRVRQLALHYGALLPYPILINHGSVSEVVNKAGAPWRQSYHDDRERDRTLLTYGREVFDCDFLDAIPMKSETGDVDGVAFVLPYSPSLAAKRSHRVYLKNMLLSEHAGDLLPDWAFFVKAIVNANDLRPTASRESFYEDRKFDEAREALGDCLRNYLMQLAHRRPEKFQRFLSLHHLALQALAVEDDECYRLFIDWLPFETAEGPMTLPEYRERHEVIRYVTDHDQFRQIARVAAAQGLGLIDGGFTYVSDLLAKYQEIFPETMTEVFEASSLTQTLTDLDPHQQDAAHDFLNAADAALRPFKCAADVRKFRPAELPALYSTSEEGRFLRSLEQSKEVANPLWAGVLNNLGRRERAAIPMAHLCFNFDNRLIARLIAAGDTAVVRRAVQMLYVQALLLGHHPLSAKEMNLLNDGLLALIEAGLADN